MLLFGSVRRDEVVVGPCSMCSVPVRRSRSTAVTPVPSSCSNDISSEANRTSRHRVPARGPGVGSSACPGRSLRTPRDWQQGLGQMSYTFLLVDSGVYSSSARVSARISAKACTDRCSDSSPSADGGLQSDLAKQLDHARVECGAAERM
jgi:hypothetical protein